MVQLSPILRDLALQGLSPVCVVYILLLCPGHFSFSPIVCGDSLRLLWAAFGPRWGAAHAGL